MKRFNASKVRALGNLQPMTDKQRARNRSARGIQMPHASGVGPAPISKPNNEREFIAPMKADYRPPRLRGRSGTRLSPEKRAMVERRRDLRAAFFASL